MLYLGFFGVLWRLVRQKSFRLSSGCCGGISIEAALSIPLIIIVISSIMQAALVAFAYVDMQDAVRDIGREVSVRRIGVNGASSGGYANTGASYNGDCPTALGGSDTTAQYIACNKLTAFASSYSVAVDEEDATGDTVVRLSVPLNSILFFNVGFLTGGSTLTAEARYVLEDNG